MHENKLVCRQSIKTKFWTCSYHFYNQQKEMRFISFLLGVGALCLDFERGTSCIKECVKKTTQCWVNCTGGSLCDYECSIKADQCFQSCPCFSIDTFSNPDQNPDYIICADQVEAAYLKCLTGCPSDDAECISGCARDYSIMIEQCPCQVQLKLDHNFKLQ